MSETAEPCRVGDYAKRTTATSTPASAVIGTSAPSILSFVVPVLLLPVLSAVAKLAIVFLCHAVEDNDAVATTPPV